MSIASLFDGEYGQSHDDTDQPRDPRLAGPDHPTMGAFTGNLRTESAPTMLFDEFMGQYVSDNGLM